MSRKRPECLHDQGILELAESLKILSDPTRLRILCLLLRGERCVCEVEGELGISQQLTSHHLNVLKEAGFLSSRRLGKSIYYSVVIVKLEQIMKILDQYFRSYSQSTGADEARPSFADEDSESTQCKASGVRNTADSGEARERFALQKGRER